MSLPLNQIVCGDCLEVMRGFPKESVDMVMFSPPYWGLRDYGVEVAKVWGGEGDCEHEWVEDIQKPKGGRAGGCFANRPSKQAGSLAQHREIKTDFCVKCGAWKGQLGLEPHPNQWISHMVEVCGEVKRVIKKTGSLYLNVGDTYFGSGVHLPHHKTREGSLNYLNAFVEPKMKSWSKIKNKGWLQPKQKLLMPSRLAIALQHEGWILRNDIIWHKPNHMPSSVKDRLTCAYEHIFHFVKARRYFYDLDAIRQPHKAGVTRWGGQKMKVPSKQKEQQGLSKALLNEERNWRNPLGKNPSAIIKADFHSKKEPYSVNNPHRVRQLGFKEAEHPKGKNPSDIIKVGSHHGSSLTKGRATYYEGYPIESDPKGKNPSDFWSINTKPFPQAHFAVYPEAICEMPIKSSCPHAVCRGCGKPKTRITNGARRVDTKGWGKAMKQHTTIATSNIREGEGRFGRYAQETVGWSDCRCNKGFDAGIVLDPMCGAGTTLVVAQKLGRRWIGIDLKAEYVEMAKKRLMRECSQKLTKFLEVSD